MGKPGARCTAGFFHDRGKVPWAGRKENKNETKQARCCCLLRCGKRKFNNTTALVGGGGKKKKNRKHQHLYNLAFRASPLITSC